MLKALNILGAVITATVITSSIVQAEESQAFVSRNAKVEAEHQGHAQTLASGAVNQKKK